MGKNLKGKSIGRGICQRKDGIYQAKIYMKGSPKPTYLYDSNLNNLRIKRDIWNSSRIRTFPQSMLL